MNRLIALTLLIISLAAHGQEQLTNIPTIYITTQNGKGIYDKENYVPGTVTIVSKDKDEAITEVTMGIRGRGNSTWGMPKKPYRIKFDKKINLLNQPAKAKSWVLLANYADKTLIRNAVAFEMSRFMGMAFSPSAVFADVVLNGEYIGNYMVSDQMQVGKGRVDIDEMDATCTEGESLTGGYFLEIDGFGNSEPVHFKTAHGLIITVKSPDEEVIQNVQLSYIRSHIAKFETALFGNNFDNPDGGFRCLVDERSLVDWYICCELSGNPDSFWSTYIYKKRSDDRLYFGPLWDFDIAFNNDNRLGDAVNKLMRDNAHEPRTWISRMWQAEWFRTAVYERWCQILDAGIEDYLIAFIDRTSKLINDSQKRNFAKWNVLNTRVYLEQFLFPTYTQGVDYLKDYVRERIKFLNASFMTSCAPTVLDDIQSGKEYYILHYVGLLATPQPSNFYIMNPLLDSQKLTFVSTSAPGVWGIRTNDGRYVSSKDGDKYCTYRSDCSDRHAQYKVEASQHKGYVRIKNLATNQYLGIEHTAHNSRISTNKSGTETNHAWKIIPVDNTNAISDIAIGSTDIVYDRNSQLLRTDADADIEVFTIEGRRIATAHGVSSLSTASLRAGVYIVRVNNNVSKKIAIF